MNNFPFTPREYQLTARKEVNQHIKSGGHPLLVMPTGTGKSKTSAMIIYDQIQLGKTVFILCPQREIFDQLLNDYAFMNPGFINDEGMRGNNRSLYVCMTLSLSNLIQMIPEKCHPDVIVIDECHHSKADTWIGIFDFFPDAVRLGMTATPVRTDGKPLGDLFDKIIEPITIREALDRGYLTEPIVISPEEYEAHIPTDETKEDREKQAEILGEPKIIGDVIDTYERILNGKPMLIACATFEHAEKVRDSFRAVGWVADHIHSGLSKADRKSMLSRVSSGRTNVLTTVGIGIEGLDISGLYALAWLRRTKSTTIFVQFNGRPMRLMDGKENCFIFDFVGNCVIHGMPDRVRKWNLTESEELDDEEDKLAWIKCWSCGTYNNPENTECHWCGVNFSDKPDNAGQGRKLPAIIDGKLVAITTDGQRTEILTRSEEKKAEIKREIEEREARRNNAEPITAVDKRKALSKGLFASSSRRELFRERLMDY